MKSINKQSSKNGFAIIVVAGLGAMVLLLGASLLMFVQVESAAIGYDQNVRVARANARMALNMAIGDLQKYAGSDLASTSTSNLFDESNDERNWTGLVISEGTNPFWVVTAPMNRVPDADPKVRQSSWLKLIGRGTSGERADVASGVFDKSVQAEKDVYVPRETISIKRIDSSGVEKETSIGEYAYWAGDLGVKASFGLFDGLFDVKFDQYGTIYDSIILPQMYSQTFDHGMFNPGGIAREPDGQLITNNASVLKSSVHDFQYRYTSAGTMLISGSSEDEMKEVFEDFTFMHRGVLSNSKNGGLKKDLSVSSFNVDDSTGFLSIMGYRSLNNTEGAGYFLRDSNGRGTYLVSPGETVDVLSDETGNMVTVQVRPNVTPVPTELFIGFGVHIDQSTKQLKLSYSGYIELFNPYNNRIGSTGDIRVVIEGLPDEATVTYNYSSSDSSDYSLDLDELINDPSSSPPRAFFIKNESFQIVPGESLSFSGNSFLKKGTGYTDVSNVLVPIDMVPVFSDTNTDTSDNSVVLEFGESRPTFVLYEDRDDGEIEIARFELAPAVMSSFSGASITLDQTSPGGDDDLYGLARQFGYYWRLKDPSEWGASLDIRTQSVRESLSVELVESGQVDPKKYGTLSPNGSQFFGGGSAEDKSMYELPVQELVSVGMLHHALPMTEDFENKLLSAGNSPITINTILDKYYFSTVPQKLDSDWDVSMPLPNTRMEPNVRADLADLQSVDSAAHLMVKGAFNVNSTSVEAWKAVLGAITLGDLNFDTSGVSSTLTAFFPVYSQTATGVFEPSGHQAYLNGVRGISDVQLTDFATAVVSRVRAGGPFANLASFVDAGVIENAIGDANINDGYSIEETGSLSQADVLSPIIPFLTTRSDTFLVRAYGNTLNPENSVDVWAEAYCEAIVQRFPEKHSTESDQSSMTPTSGKNGEFGRQFKIIAFRWMLPEEI